MTVVCRGGSQSLLLSTFRVRTPSNFNCLGSSWIVSNAIDTCGVQSYALAPRTSGRSLDAFHRFHDEHTRPLTRIAIAADHRGSTPARNFTEPRVARAAVSVSTSPPSLDRETSRVGPRFQTFHSTMQAPHRYAGISRTMCGCGGSHPYVLIHVYKA